MSDIFSIVNGWRHDVYYIVVEESYIHLNQMVVIVLFVWYLLNDLLIDKNYLVLKKMKFGLRMDWYKELSFVRNFVEE